MSVCLSDSQSNVWGTLLCLREREKERDRGDETLRDRDRERERERRKRNDATYHGILMGEVSLYH
jgi:hypothetical protein